MNAFDISGAEEKTTNVIKDPVLLRANRRLSSTETAVAPYPTYRQNSTIPTDTNGGETDGESVTGFFKRHWKIQQYDVSAETASEDDVFVVGTKIGSAKKTGPQKAEDISISRSDSSIEGTSCKEISDEGHRRKLGHTISISHSRDIHIGDSNQFHAREIDERPNDAANAIAISKGSDVNIHVQRGGVVHVHSQRATRTTT